MMWQPEIDDPFRIVRLGDFRIDRRRVYPEVVMTAPVGRPDAPEFGSNVSHYIARVPEPDPREPLAAQPRELFQLLSPVTEENASYRYGPGKWSIRQTIGHLADTERVLSYRAMCFARGETKELPGFDENLFVAHAPFDDRTLEDLKAEFAAVRASTVLLFRHMPMDAWLRRGVANRNPVSVRALAFTIVGHVRHHIAILGERYLPGMPAREEQGA